MRERDCTRDAFRLLNEYADDLCGKVGESPPKEQPAEEGAEEKEEDISVQVQKLALAAKRRRRIGGHRCEEHLLYHGQPEGHHGRRRQAVQLVLSEGTENVHDHLQPAVQQRTGAREHDQRATEMISAKNRGNKTNLKHPELAVIVEFCTRKDEDAKSQESTESAEYNEKESDKKVAEKGEAMDKEK
ncbi:conserved hypothetical protein [Culex quinquefasciatus]|uniref:Uncharacterized protein n=1 Tax=Culex quinquefasciatus TaxID=7176 RepID=B0WQP3_CULQU|nr:conserved hypothetical protein [Culex quinquefasciatus]|eukprot:XP_001851027.1 conserved hypothetical protein [Culex quinquefasciatus]